MPGRHIHGVFLVNEMNSLHCNSHKTAILYYCGLGLGCRSFQISITAVQMLVYFLVFIISCIFIFLRQYVLVAEAACLPKGNHWINL